VNFKTRLLTFSSIISKQTDKTILVEYKAWQKCGLTENVLQHFVASAIVPADETGALMINIPVFFRRDK
jgi:hypothetical protein